MNTATNLVSRRWLADNTYSVETAYAPTNSNRLRLMRMGNTFIAHASTNGTNWGYVWLTTLNMSNQVRVGLPVTAHQFAGYATGKLDNVTTWPLTPLSGIWTLPAPKILLGGEFGGLPEFQRVGGYKFLLANTVGDQLEVLASPVIVCTNAPNGWSVLDMRTFTNNLGTLTNAYGVVPFLDAQALTNGIRFYRAQKISP